MEINRKQLMNMSNHVHNFSQTVSRVLMLVEAILNSNKLVQTYPWFVTVSIK